MRIFDALGVATTIGFVTFGAVALVDGASNGAPTTALFLAALVYGLAGMMVAILAAGAQRLVSLVRRREAPHPYAWGVGAGALASFALLTGYGVIGLNRWVLLDHPWFSPISLAATAAVAVAGAGLGFYVAWILGRRITLRSPSVTRMKRALFGLLPVAAVVVVATLALTAGGVDASAAGRGDGSGSSRLPNIVIAVSDCLRARQVSAYGYTQETTPTFDRIAREGVLFEDAHASASWTLASVTGLLASTRAGVDIQPGVSATELDAATLPEVLSELGYTTVAASNNPHLSGRFGIGSRFHHFDSGTAEWERALDTTLVGVIRRRFGVDDAKIMGRVIGTLEDLPEPYLAYVHVMGGHAPYEPPDGYEPAFEIPHTDAPLTGPHAEMTISDEQRANLIARYDVMVRHADEQIARLVESLEERGQLDRTIFVYTADHGEEFGEHGNWTHGHSLHVETIHVPLAIRWPERIEARSRRSDVVSLMDLGPTLVRAAAGERRGVVPREWQGVDLGLDTRHPAPPQSAVLAELGPSFRALIGTRWKYMIDESTGRVELYDRVADPDEQTDLASHEPGVVAELEQALRARLAGSASALRATENAPTDPALVEQLRALGYVE